MNTSTIESQPQPEKSKWWQIKEWGFKQYAIAFVVLIILNAIVAPNTSGGGKGIAGNSYYGINTTDYSTIEYEFDENTFKYSQIFQDQYSNPTRTAFGEGTYKFDGTNIVCTYSDGNIRTMKYNPSDDSIKNGPTDLVRDDPSKRK